MENKFEQDGEREPRTLSRKERIDRFLFPALVLGPSVGSLFLGYFEQNTLLVILLWVPTACGIWAGIIAGRWLFRNRSEDSKVARNLVTLLLCFFLVIFELGLSFFGCAIPLSKGMHESQRIREQAIQRAQAREQTNAPP